MHMLQTYRSLRVCAQVDQLLAIQFREDMVRLIDHVGRRTPRRQTILVSATLNDKVLKLSSQLVSYPLQHAFLRPSYRICCSQYQKVTLHDDFPGET